MNPAIYHAIIFAIGNLIGPMFIETAIEQSPAIREEIHRGHYEGLHHWLKEKVYRHGSKYTAPELLERVTGGPIRIQPYIQYLRRKYGELYQL